MNSATAQQPFRVTFKNGSTYTTQATDCEDAQEKAIEAFEDADTVHDEIVAITRVAA